MVDATQLTIGNECYLWILLLSYVVYCEELLGERYHQSTGALYKQRLSAQLLQMASSLVESLGIYLSTIHTCC